MAVFRVEKNKGYTVMSNHHLRNKSLTLKAKGLLSQMLSLPDEWDFTLSGLSRINREKIDAIRTAVQELEAAGYIQRTRERDGKSRLRGADYVIYEQPKDTVPTPDLPTLDNPTQLNKELSSKDLSNTDTINYFPIHSPTAEPERNRTEAGDAYKIYEEIIKDNIEYGILQERYSAESLDEIVDLILETVCTARKTIRVAGDDYPLGRLAGKGGHILDEEVNREEIQLAVKVGKLTYEEIKKALEKLITELKLLTIPVQLPTGRNTFLLMADCHKKLKRAFERMKIDKIERDMQKMREKQPNCRTS